jgi:hypothetical protein
MEAGARNWPLETLMEKIRSKISFSSAGKPATSSSRLLMFLLTDEGDWKFGRLKDIPPVPVYD